MRRRSALVFLLVSIPFAGCLSFDSSGGSWGGGSAGSSMHTRDRDAVSDVVYLNHNDRIELLLLIEGSASGGVSSGPSPSGTIIAPTGRVVHWDGKVRQGKIHELQIDDTTFPLASGGVFYIDVRDGRTLVQQLPLDPHEIAGGKGSVRENVRNSAAKHPVIAAFCERCNPPE